jgi:hypothetical protein
MLHYPRSVNKPAARQKAVSCQYQFDAHTLASLKSGGPIAGARNPFFGKLPSLPYVYCRHPAFAKPWVILCFRRSLS